MTDAPNDASRDLIVTPQRDLSGADLGLVSRGLNEADEIKVTRQQITDARANNPSFARLSNMAIKIALEQRANWKYRLFAQIISDEAQASDDLFRALMLREATPKGSMLSTQDVVDLYVVKLENLITLIRACEALIGIQLNEAWGTFEQSGNLDLIILAAHEFGRIYRGLLNWSLDILSLQAHQSFDLFFRLLSDLALPAITNMAVFGPSNLNAIDNNQLSIVQKKSMDFTLTIRVPSMDGLHSMLQQVVINSRP
ncbi:MAG: hypothetical protein JWL77_4473 [Chthonomonadaceae bacterium]|nr:hypothetical protein [Chthonomonadaceae bacterium]